MTLLQELCCFHTISAVSRARLRSDDAITVRGMSYKADPQRVLELFHSHSMEYRNLPLEFYPVHSNLFRHALKDRFGGLIHLMEAIGAEVFGPQQWSELQREELTLYSHLQTNGQSHKTVSSS